MEAAVSGVTDKMVAFECTREGGYSCKTKLIPLTEAANAEKKVPRDWINKAGNGIEKPFVDYALPLIQGEPDRPLEQSLPRFVRLKKIHA
ncbi:Pyrophosphate--fructose 6-phosphate 1-phosphotransferase [bioreactor metagenome]|uniref:Pyrophosphate--fructose 6-phosphate 1-phosphotransferase n=1 Tax=bioreactor metagenome TaxID=1076179 RepID=A0A644YQK0_9ZZZZ